MSVFVIQQPKPGPNGLTYDLTPALEFGQPIFIFGPLDQPGLMNDAAIEKVEKLLADFTDDDYILWAGGDPAGCGIVCSVAQRINGGKYNWLRWERSRNEDGKRNGRGFYINVPIDFNRKARR